MFTDKQFNVGDLVVCIKEDVCSVGIVKQLTENGAFLWQSFYPAVYWEPFTNLHKIHNDFTLDNLPLEDHHVLYMTKPQIARGMEINSLYKTVMELLRKGTVSEDTVIYKLCNIIESGNLGKGQSSGN